MKGLAVARWTKPRCCRRGAGSFTEDGLALASIILI